MYDVILVRADKKLASVEQAYAAHMLASLYSMRFGGEVTVWIYGQEVARFKAGSGCGDEWSRCPNHADVLRDDAEQIILANPK